MSTPRGTKGHLLGQRKPLLPIISALQALLIKELSLPSSSYYFLRLFFFFPFQDTSWDQNFWQYCNFVTLDITRISHYFGFFTSWLYTPIIACFAVFPFRLNGKQYSLRNFFLSFISVVIIRKRGFQQCCWKYQSVYFIFNIVLNLIFFSFNLLCSECQKSF